MEIHHSNFCPLSHFSDSFDYFGRVQNCLFCDERLETDSESHSTDYYLSSSSGGKPSDFDEDLEAILATLSYSNEEDANDNEVFCVESDPNLTPPKRRKTKR